MSFITKWETLDEATREAYQETPFNRPCAYCGVLLATEADFAKHFIVTDRRYLNLGDCPNKLVKDAIKNVA